MKARNLLRYVEGGESPAGKLGDKIVHCQSYIQKKITKRWQLTMFYLPFQLEMRR